MTPISQGLAPALAGILEDAGLDPDLLQMSDAEIERNEALIEAERARHYAAQREAEIFVAGFNRKHAELIAGRYRVMILRQALDRFERLALGDPTVGRAVAVLEEAIARTRVAVTVPLAEARARVAARAPEPYDLCSIHLHRAREAYQAGRKLFVVCGAKGLGKSMLAALLVAERGGRCIKSTNLLTDGLWLRGSERSSVTGFTRREILCGDFPLVIDDFGQESAQRIGATIEAINEIVPARVDAGRPVVITTNLLSDGQVRRNMPRCRNADEKGALAATALSAWLDGSWDPSGRSSSGRWALFAARMEEHGVWVEVDGPNLRGVER